MVASFNQSFDPTFISSQNTQIHTNTIIIKPQRRSPRLEKKKKKMQTLQYLKIPYAYTGSGTSSVNTSTNTTSSIPSISPVIIENNKPNSSDSNNSNYQLIGKKRKRSINLKLFSSSKRRKLNNFVQKKENSVNATLFLNKKKTELNDFEILNSSNFGRRRGKNNLSCKYLFGHNNSWTLEMDRPLGRIDSEVKPIMNLLSKDLRSVRVKLTLQTQNKVYIIWIKNNYNVIVSASIIQIDSLSKRVNIEMMATDHKHRGKGLAEMMIRLIQHKMYDLPYDYQLFVSAAKDALPFWLKPRFEFNKPTSKFFASLKSYELLEERKGDVTHLMWYGYTICNTSKNKLLQLFRNFNNKSKYSKSYQNLRKTRRNTRFFK